MMFRDIKSIFKSEYHERIETQKTAYMRKVIKNKWKTGSIVIFEKSDTTLGEK